MSASVVTAARPVDLVRRVRRGFTDALRKPQYQGNPNPAAGHCYVASEVLYHALGGQAGDWSPVSIQHEGGPHWFLRNKKTGQVLDPTADQFTTPVPYEQGTGRGFLTRQPSKRAVKMAEFAGIALRGV